MVRDFHRVIGIEARARYSRRKAACPTPSSPASAAAATRSASSIRSSMTKACKLIGVEAGGRGEKLGRSRGAIPGGSPGVLQGTRSYVLQDDDGQIADPLRFRRARLRLRRPRARLAARPPPRRILSRAPMREPSKPPPIEPHRRHHSGARIRACSLRSHPPRARSAPGRPSSSTSPAAATRTSAFIARI